MTAALTQIHSSAAVGRTWRANASYSRMNAVLRALSLENSAKAMDGTLTERGTL
jgi:hypothetical protein